MNIQSNNNENNFLLYLKNNNIYGHITRNLDPFKNSLNLKLKKLRIGKLNNVIRMLFFIRLKTIINNCEMHFRKQKYFFSR